jgi:hypothetical protein
MVRAYPIACRVQLAAPWSRGAWRLGRAAAGYSMYEGSAGYTGNKGVQT